jgi:hypothetical protein
MHRAFCDMVILLTRTHLVSLPPQCRISMEIKISVAHCKSDTLILHSKHDIRRGTDFMKVTKCRCSLQR